MEEWESAHNPDFNYGEFATIKSQAGLNSYKISEGLGRENPRDRPVRRRNHQRDGITHGYRVMLDANLAQLYGVSTYLSTQQGDCR
jgi:hypothetical protein